MNETVKSFSRAGGIAPQIISVSLLIFFSVVLVNVLNFDSIQESQALILSRYGMWALFIILFITAVFYSAAVPSTVLGAASGAALGFFQGILVYITAAFIGSVMVYIISRRTLKTHFHKQITKNGYLRRLESAIDKEGLRFMFLIRFLPVHASFVNAFFGISGIKPRRFLISCLFLLPELILHVYIGYCAVSVGALDGKGWDLADIFRIVFLVLAAGAVVYLGWLASRIKRSTV